MVRFPASWPWRRIRERTRFGTSSSQGNAGSRPRRAPRHTSLTTAAEFSGMSDSLGTVQEGKLADLVLLDADPLVDIRNIGQIHAVLVRGGLFDPTALSRLLKQATR